MLSGALCAQPLFRCRGEFGALKRPPRPSWAPRGCRVCRRGTIRRPLRYKKVDLAGKKRTLQLSMR
uniref:Uncharacterized protein n=1 Tax=Rhizophora mucronata TaxID=61149 RepID=A0A2P2KD11_RHIMU